MKLFLSKEVDHPFMVERVESAGREAVLPIQVGPPHLLRVCQAVIEEVI
jgi:hypothetical protein